MQPLTTLRWVPAVGIKLFLFSNITLHIKDMELLHYSKKCFHSRHKIYGFMKHIWKIFNKNTNTCERNAIEINERENILDIFHLHIIFHSEKVTGTNIDFLNMEIFNWECWLFFFHSISCGIYKYLGIEYSFNLLVWMSQTQRFWL